MVTSLKSCQLFFLLFTFWIGNINVHQRIVKGTVYRNGNPSAGVYVTVDKIKAGYYTSFDGKYEIIANNRSKWIKFSFPDKEEAKIELDPNGNDCIDYGNPAKGDAPNGAVPLKNK